mgnify:CR=1 FL=1
MLFHNTGRKFGEVPIYISGKRNIRISTVGQVHLGVIYALSGSKERSCKYRGAGGRLYGERVRNGKTGECRGCFVPGVVVR